MCLSRFVLLYKIDSATVEQILSYVYRLFRIYGIISFVLILGVILSAIFNPEERDLFIITVLQLVFYIVNVAALGYVCFKPTHWTVILPMTTAALLCLFNIVSALYVGISKKDLYVITNIISILIQTSTVFILFKLREKLIARQLDPPQGTPTSATYNPPPIAVATPLETMQRNNANKV